MALGVELIQGALSGGGTPDVVRTGVGLAEHHTVTFINYGNGTVSLSLWLNGTLDGKLLTTANLSLLAHESLVLRIRLYIGDDLYAASDTADAVCWHDEMDSLA